MAEGDTIHRLAGRIGRELGGRPLTSVETPSPRSPLARSARRLEGKRIEAARALGKHLLIEIEGGLVIRSHLRMRGAWHLYRGRERWRKARNRAWLVLRANGAEAVQFDGPELELLRADRVRSHPKLARLGPDPLASDFTVERGIAALRTASQDLTLGEALLDQRLLAGVGNIFKSEGCFAAGLSPWRRLADLSDSDLGAVVDSTADLMRSAVASGRQPKRIYRHAGRPCPVCRTPIRFRGQGDDNRTTYWCPVCQG